MKSLVFIAISTLFLSATSVNSAGGHKKESIEGLSRDAYVWGYPAVLLSHVRDAMLEKSKGPRNPVNQFQYSKSIPDPFLGNFLAVNPENLYSWAWLDLSKEPLVLTHPQIVDRFYSVQFVDAYSNVFQTISNITQGEKAGVFIITPPHWKGILPEKTTQIRAPTSEILILAQTFVSGRKEFQKIVKIERHRQLIPLSQWNKGLLSDLNKIEYPSLPFKISKNLAANGLKFYEELSQIMAKNPPPTAAETKEAERFFAIGLKSKAEFDRFSSDPQTRRMLERGIFEGERDIQTRLASGFGVKINGWSYEMKSPPFTGDYLLRAATSQRYLFSSPSEETLQMILDVDSEARQLSGIYRYVLHFENSEFPPARKMWSIRVHEMKDKKSNNMARAVSMINEKTAKLKYNLDGSADLYLQSKKPSKSYRSNWLPLSKDANFYIVLTLYNPNNSVINRKYIAPSLVRVDEEDAPKQRFTRTMMAEADHLISNYSGHFNDPLGKIIQSLAITQNTNLSIQSK